MQFFILEEPINKIEAIKFNKLGICFVKSIIDYITHK